MSETLQDDRGVSLENLEQRANVLEKEFDRMMETAQDLLRATERYADKQDTESKCWELLDAIIEAGASSRDILDHVRVFFQFILSQMKMMGADILDVKMLWHLHDNEDVKSTFFLAVNHFGFSADDLPHLKVLLAVTYKLQTDNEKEVTLEQDNVETPEDMQDLYGNIGAKDLDTFRKIIGSFVETSFKENLKAMSYRADSGRYTGIYDANNNVAFEQKSSYDDSEVQVADQIRSLDLSGEHETADMKDAGTEPKCDAKPGTESKCDTKPALDKKQFRNTLQTWGVDYMRKTLQKVIYTVFWMLNVGRKDKTLTIIPKHKL